jgi:hypothetical protein
LPTSKLRAALVNAVLGALVCLSCVGLGGCRVHRIEFTSGQCRLDGAPITAHEVEERQASLTERIASRQPIFVVVTILIVVLAGTSHVEKLVLLFSTRRVEAKGLGERIRVALDRYRVYPVRYFSIVALTLALLVLSGGFYVYLEADKRASERTLGLLQFCHLALREAEAKNVLDEQRRNLDSLEATAGSIRTLVDKLPPDEQRKARDIVEHIDGAISKQGQFVGDYFEKSGASMKSLEERTAALEHAMVQAQASLDGLKPVPSDVHDTSGAVKALDGKIVSLDGKIVSLDGKIVSLDGKLGGLDGKVGGLDGKLGGLDGKLGGLDGKVGGLDGKVGGLDGKLRERDDRLAAIEAQEKAILARLDKLSVVTEHAASKSHEEPRDAVKEVAPAKETPKDGKDTHPAAPAKDTHAASPAPSTTPNPY